MKKIILFSGLILLAAAVCSQTSDGSGSRRSRGDPKEKKEAVKDNTDRKQNRSFNKPSSNQSERTFTRPVNKPKREKDERKNNIINRGSSDKESSNEFGHNNEKQERRNYARGNERKSYQGTRNLKELRFSASKNGNRRIDRQDNENQGSGFGTGSESRSAKIESNTSSKDLFGDRRNPDNEVENANHTNAGKYDSRRDRPVAGSSTEKVNSEIRRHSPNDGFATRHIDREQYVSRHTRVENWHNDFHHDGYREEPMYIRRVKYPFIEPPHIEIVWNIELMEEFFHIYPEYHFWDYPAGYRIPSISAYDAMDYIGEVATIYGKVEEVEYSPMNDEYYLYVGAWFPHHDFSVVIPGHIARRVSWWPAWYFSGSHIAVTGLVTLYNDKPEILVGKSHQVKKYYR